MNPMPESAGLHPYQFSNVPRVEDAAGRLAGQLLGALSDARRWGWDLPGDVAIQRASKLFTLVGRAGLEVGKWDVSTAEDGTIEVAAVVAETLFLIEIPPGGGYLQVLVQEATSGVTLEPSARLSETELVQHLERAA